MKTWKARLLAGAAGGLVALAGGWLWWSCGPPPKSYPGEQFGIRRAVSPDDADQDGVDDFTDILLGAREQAEKKPRYVSRYYEGIGYPPEDEGVCTDLVWRALRHAGYSLKDRMDADIAAHPEAYPRTGGTPDPDIDFRRVPNMQVYLERHAESLTTDPLLIGEWQPGDIVVFGSSHIGIVSDKRNAKGIPWLIHSSGKGQRRFEEDVLLRLRDKKGITGHYRWILGEE